MTASKNDPKIGMTNILFNCIQNLILLKKKFFVGKNEIYLIHFLTIWDPYYKTF